MEKLTEYINTDLAKLTENEFVKAAGNIPTPESFEDAMEWALLLCSSESKNARYIEGQQRIHLNNYDGAWCINTGRVGGGEWKVFKGGDNSGLQAGPSITGHINLRVLNFSELPVLHRFSTVDAKDRRGYEGALSHVVRHRMSYYMDKLSSWYGMEDWWTFKRGEECSWARRYCTHTMKLLPMWVWWFHNINAKCEMRIGFRFDEFGRMERFFNNSDPTNFRVPTSCKTFGKKRQEHTTFNWRYCSFPLVRDGVTKEVVDAYWKDKGWLGGTLMEPHRQIEFPAISNCIGCFHKKPETLAAMADLHPDKFRWFADQETKGKGRWLDEALTYQHIMLNREDIGREVIAEAKMNVATCDTGGCTD